MTMGGYHMSFKKNIRAAPPGRKDDNNQNHNQNHDAKSGPNDKNKSRGN